MGGLPCAKEIIDNMEALFASLSKMEAALGKGLGCMRNSILIEREIRQPTYAMQHEFEASTAALLEAYREHAEPLARLAAKIAHYVETGEEVASNEADVRKVLDAEAPPGDGKA